MAYNLRVFLMNEFTPQYVNEFKCLGSDCSDTCCQGWMINIDKDTHEKYQKVEIDEVDNIGDYLIKKNTPSSRHFIERTMPPLSAKWSAMSWRSCIGVSPS